MAIEKNMAIIVPIKITDAILFSTNVAETDHAPYDPDATYAKGIWCQVTTGGVHEEFQSVADANHGHNPLDEDPDPEAVPQYWARAGATNPYRMFDPNSGTTVNEESIDITVKPVRRFNALGIKGVNAASIQVIVSTVAAGVVYDKEYQMIDRSMITSLWHYFYTPRRIKTDLVLFDLPNLAGATLQIIIKREDGEVSCKDLVIGRFQKIGGTRYGAQVGINDYGVKKRNTFGNLYMKQRGFSNRASMDIWIDAQDVDYINSLLAEFRSTPIFFIGTELYTSTNIFGTYNKYGILISLPTYSVLTIDYEGYV